MRPSPYKDAAPLAGGAGVVGQGLQPNPNLAAIRLRAPAHRNAPKGTSEVAAARIEAIAPSVRVRILEAIRARGPDGLADFEGEALLGIKSQSYTPRRGELLDLGRIADSGKRRPTPSNRDAAVWVAIEYAIEGGTA